MPVLIKDPALRGIPKRETESFSPLALGLSMTIDYETRKLTIGETLPEEPADFGLPMRHAPPGDGPRADQRHAPTYFVVDTGGEVISISRRPPTRSARASRRADDRAEGLRHLGLGP